MSEIELPPLPALPGHWILTEHDKRVTADTEAVWRWCREYARQAVQAERERAASVADSCVDQEWPNDDQSMQAQNIAAAIRAG